VKDNPEAELAQLIRETDVCLFEAKRKGRNCSVVRGPAGTKA